MKKFFIHSTYCSTSRDDAVFVKEQVQNEDGTFTPRLASYINPKRSFYMTKPRYRLHKFKKEMEDVDRLDKFTVRNKYLKRSIAKVLDVSPYTSLPELLANPYIYGADIHISNLIKMMYVDKYHQDDVPQTTAGFLDIESCVHTKKIILITFTASSGNVYTAISRPYLYKLEGNNRVQATIGDVKSVVDAQPEIQAVVASHNLNIQYYIGEDPISLVRWIFKQVHKEKMDFIGVWNIDYDIPKIISCLHEARVPLEDIFIPPEVPKVFRSVRYRPDNNPNAAHWTHKWHWLSSPGYSQFIDSMCLFSQCRKTQRHRNSYALGSILTEELKLGKLSLSGEGTHAYMQKNKFLEYIAYNIYDTLGMVLLEDKNHDLQTMYLLSGVTDVNNFPRQQIKSTNVFYHNYKNKGKIIASRSTLDDFKRVRRYFKSTGGAVLAPERTSDIGVNILIP